jgi:hypothetical protein
METSLVVVGVEMVVVVGIETRHQVVVVVVVVVGMLHYEGMPGMLSASMSVLLLIFHFLLLQ